MQARQANRGDDAWVLSADQRARIAQLAAEGRSPDELATQFRRSPRQIKRIIAAADPAAAGRQRGRQKALPDDARREIRRRHAAGESLTTLGKEFGVNRSTAFRIIKESQAS